MVHFRGLEGGPEAHTKEKTWKARNQDTCSDQGERKMPLHGRGRARVGTLPDAPMLTLLDALETEQHSSRDTSAMQRDPSDRRRESGSILFALKAPDQMRSN